MADEQPKKLTLRERWRKACTADNIVDLSVDCFLLFFEVLSSPILIVMRAVRWVINKFFVDRLKNTVKRIVHWFIDNRVKRLAKGQNVFRYYWWLWLLSPIILTILMLGFALIYGLVTGLNIGFEIWESGVKND
jgi:ABC-type proline/glycine betaine transport system permease subunit|tara:strand:+ start:284 stop:685 length:402 start_codon:yes stop_codon:yes gene_type:complete